MKPSSSSQNAAVDNRGSVDVLLGNGDRTFQSPLATKTNFPPNFVIAGDFNHDGNLDLAGVGFGTNSVEVLLGKRREPHKPVNYAVVITRP